MKFVNSVSVTFIYKDSSTSNCIAESAPPVLDVPTSAAVAPPSVPAAAPSVPAAQPSVIAAQPSVPAVQPSVPAVQPSVPAVPTTSETGLACPNDSTSRNSSKVSCQICGKVLANKRNLDNHMLKVHRQVSCIFDG